MSTEVLIESPPISVRSHHSELSDLDAVNNDSILGHYSDHTGSNDSDSSSSSDDDADDESERLSSSGCSSSASSSSHHSLKQKVSSIIPTTRNIVIPKSHHSKSTAALKSVSKSARPPTAQRLQAPQHHQIRSQNYSVVSRPAVTQAQTHAIKNKSAKVVHPQQVNAPPALQRFSKPSGKVQQRIDQHKQKRVLQKKMPHLSPVRSEPSAMSGTETDSDDDGTVSHDYDSHDSSNDGTSTDHSDIASTITALSAAAGGAVALASMPKKQRKKVSSMASLCVGTVAIVAVVYIAYRMWSKIHAMKEQIDTLKCEIESSSAGGMDQHEVEEIARKHIERILDEPIDPNVPSSVTEAERQMPEPIYPTPSVTQIPQDNAIQIDRTANHGTDISPVTDSLQKIQDEESDQSVSEIILAGQQASVPPSSITDVIAAIKEHPVESSDITADAKSAVDEGNVTEADPVAPMTLPNVQEDVKPLPPPVTAVKTKAAKPIRRKVPVVQLKNDNKLTELAATLTDDAPAQVVIVPELKSLSTTLQEETPPQK